MIGKEDLDALMDLLAGVGKRQIPLNSFIHSDTPERAWQFFETSLTKRLFENI